MDDSLHFVLFFTYILLHLQHNIYIYVDMTTAISQYESTTCRFLSTFYHDCLLWHHFVFKLYPYILATALFFVLDLLISFYIFIYIQTVKVLMNAAWDQ